MSDCGDGSRAHRRSLNRLGVVRAPALALVVLVACERGTGSLPSPGAEHRAASALTSAADSVVVGSVTDASSDAEARPAVEDTILVLDTQTWNASGGLSDRRSWPGAVKGRWTYVGTLNDESLLTPASIAVTKEAVLVGDWGAGRVVAYDRFAPQVKWTVGREGNGPGEFRQPSLWPESESTVIIRDYVTRRIDVLGAEGALRSSRSVSALGSVSGVCRRLDGALWLKTRPSGQSAFDGIGVLRESADSLEQTRPLPFEAPIHESGMGGAAGMVGTGDGRCVVAPSYFSWIAMLDEQSGELTKHALVESVPAPAVVVEQDGTRSRRVTMSPGTVAITRNLSVTRDRAFLIARGQSSARGRLVDVYRTDPWSYEGSLVFPDQVLSISVADSTLAVVMEDATGYLRLVVATLRSPQP